MRRVSARVLPDPAGARIASGTPRLGDRGALGRVEVREELVGGARGSTYRRAGTTTGPRVERRARTGPRRERAPSSLGCVAAPISSGLRPRSTPSAPASALPSPAPGPKPRRRHDSSTVAHRLRPPGPRARPPTPDREWCTGLRRGSSSGCPPLRRPLRATLASDSRYRTSFGPDCASYERDRDPSRKFLVSGTFRLGDTRGGLRGTSSRRWSRTRSTRSPTSSPTSSRTSRSIVAGLADDRAARRSARARCSASTRASTSLGVHRSGTQA